MRTFAMKRVLPAAAGVALALPLALASVAESAAMPVDVAPRSEAAAAGSVVEARYIPKRRVVRRAPRRGNAAAAAAFGAMALGIGAAIAADRRNDYYYGYGYPAYGHPAYGYGYAPGYYGGYYRPRYYAPRYYGPRPFYRRFR
ncbi:hypothetical protein PY365_03760 [Roseiarcaceae bacterium H3SJ34-1]|uniref:hypothetical protein n=1 Tax=Terripilifer ovatus TaxID=3032367 RepID=UPI003AB99648|nr:hypothetical protein [Roseiarcaceae bacterium H3SJ34-1]